MSNRQLWNERYASKELLWSSGPNELFASEVRNLKPGTALDVACGEGRNALWLAAQGWNVTAVDFSATAIDKARQIAKKRGVTVNWIVADITTCPLDERGYDLVAILYLHTSRVERERWLPNVVRSIRPSGTFVYIGHDPSNIEYGVGGPQDPDLLPVVTEITNVMQDFQIKAATVIRRLTANEPGHGSSPQGDALDSFVRAKKLSAIHLRSP